jgi:hypothetical protein
VSGGLVRTPDGSLRFRNSALTPRLRRYLERRRVEGERLNAEYEEWLFSENMALLGKTGGTREVIRDETEEALWRAWRAYGG